MQLALFLPSLLHCKNFELRADVRWGAQRKEKNFVLTSSDGLVSHLPDTAAYVQPELQMFVELFRKKIAEWEIHEEADVLPLGRGWWAPDFKLVHRRTKKHVFLEVLGFWRRGAVEAHLQRLREFAREPYILAVSEQLKIDEEDLAGLPGEVHGFRSMPQPEEIARLAGEVATGR